MARKAANVRERLDSKTGKRTYEKRFTVEGKRYSVYGNTVKECMEKEVAKRKSIEEHSYIKNGNITLDQYFDEWVVRKSNSASSNSMLNYKSLYKNRISPALGKRKIKDIERREVLKLQSDIYKECTRNTTNKIMNILHQLMKAAMLDGIIVRNVCSSLDGLKDRAEDKAARETIHRALTEKEIKLFLKYAEQSWYFNVFRLMLETGMRAGEVCALEWRDIDINKNVIHVRRTITKGVNGKNQIGKTTKTKRSTRDIPLNAEILGILSDMRTLYNDRHGDNVKRIDGLIVQTENGNIASALNVTSAMNTVIHKAAKNGHILQGFTSHAFRATFASKCIEQGMAPNTLKEIMGHASLAMTMDLYGHVYEEQKQEAMQNIHVIKSVDFKKTDSKANS